jgi:tartrate dehydrogenase/decarboxylase / D-malate dehydrogenase
VTSPDAPPRFRIAVIPGDGIGTEVMPEGLRALDAAAARFGFVLDYEHIEWASCEWYTRTGRMMPEDWKERLAGIDAIYFGAVGWPQTVPDHISLWGSILQFRREFDQYINLRPARTLIGVPCPLAGIGPGDIDMMIVRENTEGEYSSVGGTMYAGTAREIVVQQSIFSRHGADRVLQYAFELARRRTRKDVTIATKSNGISISMPWWDERAAAMAARYPEITWNRQHIDILCARFVLQPRRFDVVVATNLFGDILSDLGPACTGTIGIAPSANINPEGAFPSLFEPVHGSAPDIAGQNVANPVGMIWSGAMMLEFLDRSRADRSDGSGRANAGSCAAGAAAIVQAIEHVIAHGPRTRDLGGAASTTEMGRAIAERITAA